jgi:hypothetical protein
MHWSLWLYSLALVQLVAAAATLYERERSLDEIAKRYTRRTPGGIHLPLVRRKLSNLERRGTASAIGLGDNVDVYVFSNLSRQMSLMLCKAPIPF